MRTDVKDQYNYTRLVIYGTRIALNSLWHRLGSSFGSVGFGWRQLASKLPLVQVRKQQWGKVSLKSWDTSNVTAFVPAGRHSYAACNSEVQHVNVWSPWQSLYRMICVDGVSHHMVTVSPALGFSACQKHPPTPYFYLNLEFICRNPVAAHT